MTFDAIEPLLVTRSIVHERFMKPPATLNGRMLADQVILLINKSSFEFSGNICLQSRITVDNSIQSRLSSTIKTSPPQNARKSV